MPELADKLRQLLVGVSESNPKMLLAVAAFWLKSSCRPTSFMCGRCDDLDHRIEDCVHMDVLMATLSHNLEGNKTLAAEVLAKMLNEGLAMYPFVHGEPRGDWVKFTL